MTRASGFLAAFMTVLGALLASSASAQGLEPSAFTVISPIFGQLVAFSLPSGVVTVHENTSGPVIAKH